MTIQPHTFLTLSPLSSFIIPLRERPGMGVWGAVLRNETQGSILRDTHQNLSQYLHLLILHSSIPVCENLSNLSRWEKLTWLTLYFFMSSIYVINFVSWILWGSDFWYYSIQNFLLSTLSSLLGAVLRLKSWALTPFFPLCISFEVTVPW